MSKTSATEKHSCEFCNREFIRESTMMKHICENKRRWQDKDQQGNRIGFQCWLQFYVKNTATKKQRTYLDFIKSSYYLVFVKFGHYCVSINALNIMRYADWLMKNKIKIDSWCSDTNYNKFLIEYLKDEDPLDAIARSIETTIELAKVENVQSMDCLRYCNRNKICYAITNGKISPWMLYQSVSGVNFLEGLDVTQQKMILDYINPEQWAVKFKRDGSKVSEVKELLNAAGY
jgi:hypothetical protein